MSSPFPGIDYPQRFPPGRKWNPPTWNYISAQIAQNSVALHLHEWNPCCNGLSHVLRPLPSGLNYIHHVIIYLSLSLPPTEWGAIRPQFISATCVSLSKFPPREENPDQDIWSIEGDRDGAEEEIPSKFPSSENPPERTQTKIWPENTQEKGFPARAKPSRGSSTTWSRRRGGQEEEAERTRKTERDEQDRPQGGKGSVGQKGTATLPTRASRVMV